MDRTYAIPAITATQTTGHNTVHRKNAYVQVIGNSVAARLPNCTASFPEAYGGTLR